MSQNSFETINPATGEKLATYTHLPSAQVERKVEEAFQSFHRSKSKSVAVRSQELKSLGQALRRNSEKLGRLITLEMGKAISDSFAEIEKCAKACDYFSENLEAFLAPEPKVSDYNQALIVKDSVGPVLAIMPWNFPIWQAIRFAAPAVGIGNPILLKHSDQMAGTAEMMEQIFNEVSPGLLYNLRIDHNQAMTLIGDKRVRGVTLTGSTSAGKKIAEVAGEHLKKTVLELGGNDAYLVFEDADISQAATICARARMVNNGQSCIAGKRFLVQKTVLPRFLQAFEESLRKIKMGDPLKKETQVGSLAAKKFQKQLLEQCEKLEQTGAEKVFDLSAETQFDFSAAGAFFPARVYLVNKDSDLAFKEEFFGPVALVFDFENETEALGLCNRSPFGLGGGVFSRDLGRAQKVARQMEAGFIAINEQVKSDPRLPFGGVKESGYGRELSLYGFNEFCNIKTIGVGGELKEPLRTE